MVKLGPRLPMCRHRRTVPAEDLAGERVAVLCLNCDHRLPVEWKPSFTDVFFDPDLISDGRGKR